MLLRSSNFLVVSFYKIFLFLIKNLLFFTLPTSKISSRIVPKKRQKHAWSYFQWDHCVNSPIKLSKSGSFVNDCKFDHCTAEWSQYSVGLKTAGIGKYKTINIKHGAISLYHYISIDTSSVFPSTI